MPKREGGRSDERERVEVDLHAAGSRAFVNHYVDDIVFHRRVEILLNYRAETVYLIDEQHISRIEGSEQAGKVARFVKHRT